GPRRHYRRDRAGVAAEHGDEALPVQPDPAHVAVHDERRPRHVAAVFQDADGQEEDGDLRDEHHHAPHAGDDPVDDEAAQVARGEQRADQRPDGTDERLGTGGERRRAAEDGLEDQRHYGQEDQRPADAVEGDGVYAIADLVAGGRIVDDVPRADAADPAVAQLRLQPARVD